MAAVLRLAAQPARYIQQCNVATVPVSLNPSPHFGRRDISPPVASVALDFKHRPHSH